MSVTGSSGGPSAAAAPASAAPEATRFSWGLVVLIFLLLHAIFALELWLDLRHAAAAKDLPLDEVWRSLDGSAAMARMAGTTISRAYNVLVSMVLTSIALAIPLTANMYTPKLIDIFIKDRVNVAVLAFFVISSAQAIWSTQATWDQGALHDVGGVYPRVSLWLAFESITLGWAILIPYFYYVFRFLNPTNIITRVSGLVTECFDAIPAEPRRLAEAQRELEQRILHLGNVILRAIDRADRDVTLDGIRALQRVVLIYQDRKPALPPDWFRMDASLFVGLSPEAVEVVRSERIWVEHKCLHQLSLAYNASLAKMQDAISAISDVNRQILLHAEDRGDRGLLELGIRFFNTFIREAIKRRDVHAIFDVFQQYKELAHHLVVEERDDLAVEIARHIKYYAEFARLSGLNFVLELAAYDVERLVEWAYEREAPRRRELLGVFFTFEGVGGPRLVKARLLCGGFFEERGMKAEAALVRKQLEETPDDLLESALSQIMDTRNPIFWEVTDRGINIDYASEARKDALVRFALPLHTEPASPAPPPGPKTPAAPPKGAAA